jgi:hypothetical protein
MKSIALGSGRLARLAVAAALIPATMLIAGPADAWVAGSNTSNSSPSLTSCMAGTSQAYEYLAFTGTNGQINLLQYFAPESFSTSGGNTIIAQFDLGQNAVGAPSITCVNEPAGAMYIAWRTSSNGIDYGKIAFPNGKASLGGITSLGQTTDASPALTADAGAVLVVAWAGTDPMHHINVETITLGNGVTNRVVTTDFTRANASVGMSWNGEPFGSGDIMAVGFLASAGTPFIFLGQYDVDTGDNHLGSIATSQSSTAAPTLSETGGVLPAGGQKPTQDGTTEVIWKGFTNNRIYFGVWGTAGLTEASTYPDTSTNAPAVDICETAYTGATNRLIFYDTEPFFGTCPPF